MRVRVSIVLSLIMVLLFLATQVLAINYGEPDGNGHPYVGVVRFYDENGGRLWRCSGTLMSPTIFLTAGHCTEAPAAQATVWFESEIHPGDGTGYPLPGGTGINGTPHGHPQYNPNAFYLYDLGVVVLDTPVAMSQYGALPALGTLDGLATARGRQDTTITAVGYGLQQVRSNPFGPDFTIADIRRERATLDLLDLNGTAGVPAGTSVSLSGNANTGGTCFGDSGGPLFLNNTNIVVAVTSFGLNGNCAGIGGGYRVDTADDLAWLATFGF